MLIWQYYSNLSTDSNNPSPNPSVFVPDIDKMILKMMWTFKRPRRANTILKEVKVGRFTFPNSKFNMKLPRLLKLFKIIWCYHTNKRRDQWNRIDSPHFNCQLTFNRYQSILVEGRIVLLSIFCKSSWDNWIFICIKNNLKWIEGLNVHVKAIIFLQENKGVRLHYRWLGILR